MSDRLFDGTLDRIERLPRGRLADLHSRLPAMNLNIRLAAAAAVVIALVGAGLVINRVPSVGGEPSPTPSADASVTTAALQSMWEAVGDRQSPGDWGVGDDSFNIDSTGLRIEQVHGDVLSTLSLTEGGNRLVLAFRHGITTGAGNSNQQWLCHGGDEGVYSVRLTPDGRTLTLGLVSDPCVPRAAFLQGDWTRSVCQPGYYACAQAPTPPVVPAQLDPELAATLQARWTSDGERPIPGSASSGRIAFAFEPTTLSMNGSKGWVQSDWSIRLNGYLQVKLTESQGSLTSQHWTCRTGDEGSYQLQVLDDEATLTVSLDTLVVSLVADACETRSSILVGRWLRCPPELGTCPGWVEGREDLPPGPSTSLEEVTP